MSETTDDMEQYEPEEWQNYMNNQNDGGHEMPNAEEMHAGEPIEALVVRDKSMPPPEARQLVTSEQAKVDAIASLTMSAYASASKLKLTPEEIEGLKREFPDEAFKSGAAGKENLIYIEHAFLRDRLNEVLGVGQWSIVPRARWAEDFTIPPSGTRREPTEASRVYVEAMLLIRGCFVAEAVGDMVYYKNNQTQNKL